MVKYLFLVLYVYYLYFILVVKSDADEVGITVTRGQVCSRPKDVFVYVCSEIHSKIAKKWRKYIFKICDGEYFWAYFPQPFLTLGFV